MAPIKRRSSTKITVPSGVWSVKLNGTFSIEGVTESEAWQVFLRSSDPGQLLKKSKVMSERTPHSPIIDRK